MEQGRGEGVKEVNVGIDIKVRSGLANDTCIVGSFMLADMHIVGCHIIVITLWFVRKESNDLPVIPFFDFTCCIHVLLCF